jgi:hypothetical protein
MELNAGFVEVDVQRSVVAEIPVHPRAELQPGKMSCRCAALRPRKARLRTMPAPPADNSRDRSVPCARLFLPDRRHALHADRGPDGQSRMLTA